MPICILLVPKAASQEAKLTLMGRLSSFLNIRVADIGAVYERRRARGAQFLTPRVNLGSEIRCYIRDRDGHLIEVGQLVGRVDEGTRGSRQRL